MSLTPEQQSIVQHEAGHARVLAVAGSGKTFTMGHRIAYLVQERGVNPKRIRALMFNRLAKEQFEQRLMTLGFVGLNMPYITTFHGFAHRFISMLIKQGGMPNKEFWIGEDEEKGRILLHKVIRELRNEKLIPGPYDPFGDFDIEEVTQAISLYKGALISPDRAGHTYNNYIPKIYQRFEQHRVEQNALTFDDFVPIVVRRLSDNEALKDQWSSSVDYLIVDEYQDVNYGQQKLVEILAGNRAEIMVVGDDDQTIYEWRGARPNYIIRDFQSVFDNKPHTTYRLSHSFRFGPIIAQAAQNSIQLNTNRVDKELIAYQSQLENIVVLRKEGGTEIYRDFAQEIIRLVQQEGVSPTEIWVLGRMYAQLAQMESMLLSFNVPYHVLGGKPFYKRPEITKLLSYLELGLKLDTTLHPSLARKFMMILNYPNRKISSKNFGSVLEQGVRNGSSLRNVLQWAIEHAGVELNLGRDQVNDLRTLLQVLDSIFAKRDESYIGMVAGLLGMTVKTTGLEQHFDNYYGKGEVSHERKSMVEGFIAFAERLAFSIPDFLNFITNLDSTRGAPAEQLITLSTVHRTKGLEFDYVFIPVCMEGFMPCLISSSVAIFDKSNPDLQTEPSLSIENERRLFYVAITRARKALYIGTIPKPQTPTDPLPSRFLEEVNLEGCQDILSGLSNVRDWSDDQINKWMTKVKTHAGKKSLIRNLEKYLSRLEADNLLGQVSRINASTPAEPIRYSLAYKHLDTEEDENDTRPNDGTNRNYWDDVRQD